MTGSAFRFTPDTAGIVKVSSGADIAPVLDAAARTAADRMRALAANMDRASYFAFRTSIVTVAARRGSDGKHVAYAGSTSPGWHLQEYGTSRQAPRGIIRRGIKTTPGIRFEEHR